MISEKKYESLLEGINDPGVFKAVFMAGGPGSGKSLAAKKLGFTTMGLRPVNSDSSFERGLKKAGLSLKMPEDEEEQRDAIRVHAKAITGKRQEMFIKGRLGLVIDSTARDIKNVLKQKILLEKIGYETAMVFVNTSLETALDRNRERERSIPDKIVKDNHAKVRSNMGKLQNAFGRANFFIIDNDGDVSDLNKNTTKVFPRLQSWIKGFPDNKMAQAWKTALTMKPMKNVALAAEYEHPAEMEKRLEMKEQTITEAVLNVTVDPNRDIPTTRPAQQAAFKIVAIAKKEYGLKAVALDNHVRLQGVKRNIDNFQKDQRIISKKVKMNIDNHDKTTPQIDKMLNKELKKKHALPETKSYNFKKFNEDRATDALKQKQQREKEQLKDKHDRENDRDRLRITRDKNKESGNQQDESKDVSPEVMKTKEKIYKDLKKKREYFEKEYGEKADEVMHGTAMNMAKKQHKVAEGKFQTELSRQLQLEVLSMQQRRKIGMRMRRLSKKIARAKERKKKRMKDPRALKTKAQKQARAVLFKKMSGGKASGDLSMGARIAIGKKLDKKKGAIAKLAKKLMPKVKKAEIERLAAFRQKQNQKDKQ